MTKSAERVRQKMLDRVRTAGSELKAGMEAAEDPLQIISKDPDGYAKKLQKGVDEAVRRGKYQAGVKKAAADNRWKKSIDRAAENYEKSTDVMVDRAMESYEPRMAAIKAAKAACAHMPRGSLEQNLAYAAAYGKAVSKEFDGKFGRKN
jgi:ElaB/YqjD/DUF883 family membrane-anchored ribosome-binding protein